MLCLGWIDIIEFYDAVLGVRTDIPVETSKNTILSEYDVVCTFQRPFFCNYGGVIEVVPLG